MIRVLALWVKRSEPVRHYNRTETVKSDAASMFYSVCGLVLLATCQMFAFTSMVRGRHFDLNQEFIIGIPGTYRVLQRQPPGKSIEAMLEIRKPGANWHV